MSKKPHVVFLLDESGSMSYNRDSVINTFNEYVNSVKDTAKSISLYTFDCSGIRNPIFKEKNPKPLTGADYKPNGLTPLYDAITSVVYLFQDSKRPVQLVIHTDGAENHSKEATFESTKALLDKMTEEKGWLVVYIGEGLVAQDTMRSFKGVKLNFQNDSFRGAALNELGKVTASYSSTGVNDPIFYCADGSDTINVELGDTAGLAGN